MIAILFECDITDFVVSPPEEYEKNQFVISDNSLQINLLDDNNIMLTNTEISKEDALQLAKLILLKYS